MTQLINIDFSGTLTTDFDKGAGTYCAYTAGALVFSAEGAILAKTGLGTSNKWMRFTMTGIGAATLGIGFALGDSAGNCIQYILANGGTSNLRVDTESDYDAYLAPVSEQAVGGSYFSMADNQAIGVTFEDSTETARIWFNVTAAEPGSVTLWDSRAADVTTTLIAWSTMGSPTKVGFGSWTSSPGTHSFDNFTAGDFGAGGSAAGMGSLLLAGDRNRRVII